MVRPRLSTTPYSDELFEKLFEARKEVRDQCFAFRQDVAETRTYTRSIFASTVIPTVLICGLGSQLMVASISTGWFVPSAITLDIAKDLANVFGGAAVAFATVGGITFQTLSIFAATTQKKEEALHKAREHVEHRENLLFKNEKAFRKAKLEGDK